MTVGVFPTGSYTTLSPSNTVAANQALIDADATGQIWWPAGTYRLTSSATIYRPRTNQIHRFETGPLRIPSDTAVIKGSAIVTGWTQGSGADSDKWFVTGQTQDFGDATQPTGGGTNVVAYTEREDYYKDGIPMIAVTTKAEVTGTTNKRYLDQAADTVWIGFNPSGNTMERLMSDFTALILIHSDPAVSGVTLKGGIVEHSLNNCVSVGLGFFGTEDNVVIEDMEMRYAHFRCFNVSGISSNYITGLVLRHCYLHHGGSYNLTGGRIDSPVFEYCHFAFGNDLHYGNRGTGSDNEGASKFVQCTGTFAWRYNWSHDNDGDEWWDTNPAISIQATESVIENNYRWGLNIEDCSGTPSLVSHCLLRDNGQILPVWGEWGSISTRHEMANLYTTSTNDLELANNLFQSKASMNYQRDISMSWQARSTGTGPQRLRVHNNRFDRRNLPGGTTHKGFESAQGSLQDLWYQTSDNKWDFNEYHIPTGQDTNGQWFNQNGAITWNDWRDGGSLPFAPPSFYDPNSTITADLT